MTVPDATLEEPVKSVYAKKEALVPAFNFYIGNAEALSEAKGLLDFKSIKTNLYKAIKFAPTSHHKKEAKKRLNKIDFMFLIYKADVAAGKNTVEGLEAALEDLSKAAALGAEKAQRELLDHKKAEITETLATLEEKIKAEKAVALEEEAAEMLPAENTPGEAPQPEENLEVPANQH